MGKEDVQALIHSWDSEGFDLTVDNLASIAEALKFVRLCILFSVDMEGACPIATEHYSSAIDYLNLASSEIRKAMLWQTTALGGAR